MKKIMVIALCCCFFLSNFSFAVTNDIYKVDLPDDFKLIYGEDANGLYNGDDMSMLVTGQKSEFGMYFKDVKTIFTEESYRLGLYGLSKNAKIEKINGVNFLREEIEDEDEKGIIYLGTTGNRLVLIVFGGDNLDENKVNDIMSTFKLKGIPTGLYTFLMEYGLYGIVLIVFVGSWLIKVHIKAKKLEKSLEPSLENDTTFNTYDNTYQNNYTNSGTKTYYTQDPLREKKDEWKL